MGEIKVSVIVPVYNAEKYLRETLDSILNQTFKEIEVICVDDGSTDSSVSIIHEYMEKDNRIALFFQNEESDNAAKARNLGLKKAKGDYLLFLDADDVSEKNLIELVYRKALETEADIVMFNVFVMDTQEEMDVYVNAFVNPSKIRGKEIFVPKNERAQLFQIMGESVWNKLFKKELIIDNDVFFRPLRQCDDYEFVALASVHATKIAVLNRRLLHYRRDAESSQTSDYSVNWKAGYMASYYLKEELERRNLYNIYKISYVNKAVDKITFYMNHIFDIEVFRLFFREIKKKIKELELLDLDSEEYESLNNFQQICWILKSATAEEYLFWRTRAVDLYQGKSFRLPISGNKDNIKLVLYGAGQEGNRIRNLLCNEKHIEIVGWLDKDYLRFDGNVKDPEELKNLEYDYVFIAIESKRIVQQVKKYLLEMGCEATKIVGMTK